MSKKKQQRLLALWDGFKSAILTLDIPEFSVAAGFSRAQHCDWAEKRRLKPAATGLSTAFVMVIRVT